MKVHYTLIYGKARPAENISVCVPLYLGARTIDGVLWDRWRVPGEWVVNATDTDGRKPQEGDV